jgi:phosphoglucosamine mutase
MLDCAHGAAYKAAPALFRKLKADVAVLADEPTGMNINEGCGATHPEFLASHARVESGWPSTVTPTGSSWSTRTVVANGDVIMAMIARHWKAIGKLKNNTVVATVMSNLGFSKAMLESGIDFVQTRVGDRYVLEGMQQHKAILGGEQSGHVIFLDRGRTGDGLLTGIRLLEVVAGHRPSACAELRQEAMTEYPQVLLNVRVADRNGLADAAGCGRQSTAGREGELGTTGACWCAPPGPSPWFGSWWKRLAKRTPAATLMTSLPWWQPNWERRWRLDLKRGTESQPTQRQTSVPGCGEEVTRRKVIEVIRRMPSRPSTVVTSGAKTRG